MEPLARLRHGLSRCIDHVCSWAARSAAPAARRAGARVRRARPRGAAVARATLPTQRHVGRVRGRRDAAVDVRPADCHPAQGAQEPRARSPAGCGRRTTPTSSEHQRFDCVPRHRRGRCRRHVARRAHGAIAPRTPARAPPRSKRCGVRLLQILWILRAQVLIERATGNEGASLEKYGCPTNFGVEEQPLFGGGGAEGQAQRNEPAMQESPRASGGVPSGLADATCHHPPPPPPSPGCLT